MSEARVWKDLTQAQLDANYNNVTAVHDSAERMARLAAGSARLRARMPDEIDIPYGSRPRNRFDVFRCGRQAAPLFVFIHGGWWQRNSKEVFSAIAEGPLAHGFDVALLGYTLAPEASLREIASEIRVGLDALMRHQSTRAAPARCILSGWSAGGHLTALTMDHPAVASGLAISGAFELEPIRLSYINEKLRLPAEDVAALSPARIAPTGKPLALTFGLAELAEMQWQTANYAGWCLSHGAPVMTLPLADHNHFSILDELRSPDGALVPLLATLAKKAS